MHIATLVRFIETELTEIWRYTIQKGEKQKTIRMIKIWMNKKNK